MKVDQQHWSKVQYKAPESALFDSDQKAQQQQCKFMKLIKLGTINIKFCRLDLVYISCITSGDRLNLLLLELFHLFPFR